MVTTPKPVSELTGLVYGATEIPFEGNLKLYNKPAFWACVVGVVFIVLNILFW
jgi:solute:Na+ symporter, SSS family